jgi:hypothetical protein
MGVSAMEVEVSDAGELIGMGKFEAGRFEVGRFEVERFSRLVEPILYH